MKLSTTQKSISPSQRPRGLTVLCVLTFIGTVIELSMSIDVWWWVRDISLSMQASTMAESEILMEFASVPGMNELILLVITVALLFPNVTLASGVVSSLLCFFGAVQMWKLKKVGYYIYVVGECVSVIILPIQLIIIGIATGFAFFEILFFIPALLIGVIIPIVFIILYRLNLKHLL